MNKIQRSVLAFFFRRHWRKFAVIAALGTTVAALEAAALGLLMATLTFLLASPGQTPATGKLLSALTGVLNFGDPLVSCCVALLVLTPIKSVLTIVHDTLVGYASGRVQYETRKEFLEKFFNAPYQYLLSQKEARLTYVSLSSTAFLSFIVGKVPQLVMELLRVAAIIILLFSLHPSATAALLAVTGAVMYAINRVSSAASYARGKQRERAILGQRQLFTEVFGGFKQMKVYGVGPVWLSQFDAANRAAFRVNTQDAAWMSLPRNVLEALAVLLLFGGILAMRLSAPARLIVIMPVIGTFAMALFRMLPSVAAIARLRLEIVNVLPEVESVHEALTLKFPPARLGRKLFSGLSSGIAFKDVAFAYEGRPPVISGLNLALPSKKTTAIVGNSGAGKTTLLNLLLRLLEPTSGEILVDGVPLSEIDPKSWLSRIGLVSQDSFIIHASIADNIVFGRQGFSRADVERAARIAHAHDFIAQTPEGYETIAGERGLKLSGGQQQRISIARAVLGNPDLFIFDEATSSLDTVSEAAVQSAIAAASAGRTVIQIAHRLSTVKNSDAIVVLENGRVAEQGRHEELLSRQGAYARFFLKQDESAKVI